MQCAALFIREYNRNKPFYCIALQSGRLSLSVFYNVDMFLFLFQTHYKYVSNNTVACLMNWYFYALTSQKNLLLMLAHSYKHFKASCNYHLIAVQLELHQDSFCYFIGHCIADSKIPLMLFRWLGHSDLTL
ncbi:hypothetical protein PAEPH01_0834 [Pancytospora epiphaga]|nr:hypothetical protein PAEPH01_0834 [Pancytospora epiphaga]